jgi:PilZ domain
MTTPPVRMERRVGQRFSFLLPVSLRDSSSGAEGLGFTQDVSSRGAYFFTDAPLHEGAEIELTLQMPAEITLGERMRVRCRGRILRVVKPADLSGGSEHNPAKTIIQAETKIGVAVRIEGYEYLPESAEGSAAFQRLSALHERREDDRAPALQAAVRPIPS